MESKSAFITGITGQDGSYLAEFLLKKGYDVHGLVRRMSAVGEMRDFFASYSSNLFLHHGDLNDSISLHNIIKKVKPDEVYNLGGQSNIGLSLDTPEYTSYVTGVSVVRLLAAIRQEHPSARFYQASSSEIFGNTDESPQNEKTRLCPRNPYGVAKAFGHWATINYREFYGMFACSGVMYNHESPRRDENFVSRKITRTLTKIALGDDLILSLGNLDARRDWGFAGDYVRAMWLILQQEIPEDFILSTGETHSVREFVENACGLLGIDMVWEGEGMNERGINKKTNKLIVRIEKEFYRRPDNVVLVGNPAKALHELHWKPEVSFQQLVDSMIQYDKKLLGAL